MVGSLKSEVCPKGLAPLRSASNLKSLSDSSNGLIWFSLIKANYLTINREPNKKDVHIHYCVVGITEPGALP